MNQPAADREFIATDDPVYRQDQLVVATPHVAQVLTALDGLGLGVTVDENDKQAVQSDPRLGLSLLTLSPVGEGPAPGLDVGLLISQIQQVFEDDNQGWSPTIGKNRYVDDQVIGGGSMSYGGFGDPQPLGDEEGVRERADFASVRRDAGAGVVVGLVDTRISGRSVPLAGTWTGGSVDIVSDEGAPPAEGYTAPRWAAVRGHATFVAGLILSAAPSARLIVRGVLAPAGRTDSWTVARAIAELGQSDIDVLNLSFTCLTADGKPPLALATAISKVDPRTVIVAAAGNHGAIDSRYLPVVIDGQEFGDPCTGARDIRTCAAFPAALDGVVAVGARASDGDGPTSYTPRAAWVDVLARGDAASTFVQDAPYGGFARWEGTSFAAALVSGAIAAGTKPGLRPAQVAYDKLPTEPGVQTPGEPPTVILTRAWVAAQSA